MHAFNTNRVQCLITSTNSLLKSYWDLGVIQKDRVAHESWKMRIFCKRVPFAQSLWTLVFFYLFNSMVCRVVLRRRDCRRVCRVQMLPELRATLFGTNPNRKHVDWSKDDLAIVGPGGNSTPVSAPPVSYSRTARDRYCGVAKHYVGWGHGHIGANGVSWPPPGKKWMKNYKAKTCKKSSILCLCYILRAIGASRCRERRYVDHIFIEIQM